jgi:EAL domain-containing protein (putative c-di-GMP-specific phosphodiesterase class I)
MLTTQQLLINNFPQHKISWFTSNFPETKIVNFYHRIQEKYLDHLGLINDLPEYLERDDLNLCYQPQINLETGKTNSVEALIRWQHKLAGAISPDIFIPLAEQSGHIHALTFWVLNHSLHQLQIWKNNNLDIKIAVNLSMFNLHDNNFPNLVARLLDKWTISPEQLILEITEGVIMHEPEHAMKIMSKLCNMGIILSLDDFGSGYSSLCHLSKLPISELKIDRVLVRDINRNSKNETIVRSTIELAKRLGLNVVAEGVENMEICNTLKALGCDTVQGFHFCKPVCSEEIISWLFSSDWGINYTTSDTI